MKATVEIGDRLAERTKRLAERTERAFEEVVRDALEDALRKADESQSSADRITIPIIPMMFPAGLDLSDNNAVLEYLDLPLQGEPRPQRPIPRNPADPFGNGLPFPTWHGGGLPDGFDMSSNAAMLASVDALEADHGSP